MRVLGPPPTSSPPSLWGVDRIRARLCPSGKRGRGAGLLLASAECSAAEKVKGESALRVRTRGWGAGRRLRGGS